ncbi:MAG: LCP family protein [Actinomycetota bacterium]
MIKRSIALLALVASVCVMAPLAGDRSSSTAAPITGGRVHQDFQPRDGKVFVLIIGNDARSGNPDRSRADAIHLAGINTRTMKGGVLNFPRDSYINIPGSGSGRINEALYRGGPELVVRSVESLTGIRIDYWLMTGFVGFQKAIEDLGRVPMKINQGIYDQGGSGAKIPAGTEWLYGASSLAYVRTRKAFAGGDIARTTNQGKYLLALLRKLRTDIERNPASMFEWMGVARKWTRLDIPPDELFRLAVLASQVKPGDVGNVTVPVTVGSAGAASVVFIQPEANSIYSRFKAKGSL